MNQKYDLMCIFNPKAGEEKIDAAISRIEKKITSAGGTVDKTMKQGMRRVATRMREFKSIKDGYFVTVQFSAPAFVPKEINAAVRVNEDIMRFILTKAIEMPPAEEVKAEESAVEVNPEMLIGKPE